MDACRTQDVFLILKLKQMLCVTIETELGIERTCLMFALRQNSVTGVLRPNRTMGLIMGFYAGTRIVYERAFLMNLRNSPISRTPPRSTLAIPSELLKGTPAITTNPAKNADKGRITLPFNVIALLSGEIPRVLVLIIKYQSHRCVRIFFHVQCNVLQTL